MRKSGEWTGPVEYIFMDTGAEHPKTYEFIKKCVEHFGIELTCLQGDFEQPVGVGHSYNVVDIDSLKCDPVNGPFGRMMVKYGVPKVTSAWCTSRMKEETHDKYCNDKYGKGNYITWLGIRADEPRRLRIGKSKLVRYMAEITDFEKLDVLRFWEKMPFNLEFGKENHLGNCVFCIKKSANILALAARDEPSLLGEWKSAIEKASDRANKEVEINTGGLFSEKIKRFHKKGIMYRGAMSIDGIVERFADFTREEIAGSLRVIKTDETNCSESCEPFSLDQPDMFEVIYD
jgi:hypothetical protein